MKKSRLFSFALLFVASFLSAIADHPKPNIVLIISDDHGTGDLGCYGNEAIHTPNLDKLAEEGVCFDRAYSTAASCTSSRSVIQTGLYAHANGLIGLSHAYHHFRAFETTLSLQKLLVDLGGYTTARVGKHHVDPEELFEFQQVIDADIINPVDMGNKSRAFLKHQGEKPFFLKFGTIDPHRSGSYVEEHPLRPNDFHNKKGGHEGEVVKIYSEEDVVVPPYLPDNPAVRAELAQYYQSVARMDQGVGILLDSLKEFGLWDNTLIIYISDNGIAFPGAKTNVYEAALRLPCIVKAPHGKQKNVRSDALVSWVDLTPTILDFAGLLKEAELELKNVFENHMGRWDNTAVAGFQGTSFRSVVEDPKSRVQDEVFASHSFHEVTMYYPMRTIITDDFKLIWNINPQLPYPHASDLWHSATWQWALKHPDTLFGDRDLQSFTYRPEFEFFNLKEDPFETTNLIDQPKYAHKIEDLKERLRSFQKRTRDPWLLKWNRE